MSISFGGTAEVMSLARGASGYLFCVKVDSSSVVDYDS